MSTCSLFVCCLQIRRPPISTRTDTLFPDTTLCPSRGVQPGSVGVIARDHRARVARKLLGVLAHKGRRGGEDKAVAADLRRGLERGEMRCGGILDGPDRKSKRLNSSH